MITFCFVLWSVSTMASENDPDALRSFQHLDDDRRTADPFDSSENVLSVAHESGRRHAELVAAENLERAQFVPRGADGVRGIERKDSHLLEVPHHRRAVKGDRRSDARDDGIVL
jgi:hypothetical protein